MAKLTRLATTVTARYYPAPDLTDAFYLDGRLAGKREARSADITVDKEDRGFFFSVFSHGVTAGRDATAEPVYEPPLRKLYTELKTGRKVLDHVIGDLVNTAVSVTGRMKIQTGGARSPFFAGAIVKDSEAFAITMGKGLAFLYRDDTLFPLTATDIRIDPVNTQRQRVEDFHNYCASKAATALCSNIVQLKMDDCLILCNREVYEALGQQELLRILYDAEDQCDAAGVVVTEASAKLPGVPMQFMISFVEAVSAPEKGGIFGFGKKKNAQAYDGEDDAIEVPIANQSAMPSAPAVTPTVPDYDEPDDDQTAEPLFFGQEASNPFVMPKAEEPVTPTGPEDPVIIEDEPMQPYGEPVDQTEPTVDEGGFVRTSFDDTEKDSAVSDEEDDAVTEALPVEDNDSDASLLPPPNAPRYVPSSEPANEAEALFFGDQLSTSDAAMNRTLDDAFGTPEPQARPAAPTAPKTTMGSSFFIPFASEEPQAEPEQSTVDDIPDMPLYDAPSYTPPTYPANSYSPQEYESAGVYARGSYSVDEDEDADMKRNAPPPSQGRRYSYTPPQQTVPSYGVQREAQNQRTAQPGRPGSAASAQRSRQEPKRYAQDIFDQEQNSDYGESDASYKRNRNLTIILFAVSIICVVILIIVAVSRMNQAKATPTTATTAASVTVQTESTASTAAVTQATTGTAQTQPSSAVNYMTNPPIGLFYFSDSTGFRTWWDVMYYGYQKKIENNSDPRIAFVIAYNNLPADYVPKAGDSVYLPDVNLFDSAPTTTPTTTAAAT